MVIIRGPNFSLFQRGSPYSECQSLVSQGLQSGPYLGLKGFTCFSRVQNGPY